jgi:phage/plasmid primase-like uncharacterized protein
MRSNHYPRAKSNYRNHTVADLLRLSSGRWPEILRAAGMRSDAIDGRRGRPCPRCGGDDRYSPMADVAVRGAVLCRSCHNSSTEPRAGDGIATLRWWMGCNAAEAIRWLASYLGVGDAVDAPVMSRPIERRLSLREHAIRPEQWLMMSKVWMANMRPEYMSRAADLLGLPTEPLERLGVGWSPAHRATTWPMRDGAGDVIGIRLRCPTTGAKRAITGSRAGLIFCPWSICLGGVERLYIVEGPTDTAAMLSLGVKVVGVPSAGCGADLLVELSRRIMPTEIVIVADADGAGVDGAERIADAVLIVASVRIIQPGDGAKDARAWVVGGADRSMVDGVADAAPVRRLMIGGAV